MFQYKGSRKRFSAVPLRRPDIQPAKPEMFVGVVHGLIAKRDEELYARALDKLGFPYWFRLVLGGARGMPNAKELDFLIQAPSGQFYARQLADFEFIHHGQKANAYDQLESAMIKEYLRQDGIMIDDVVWIDSKAINTQENANRAVQEFV